MMMKQVLLTAGIVGALASIEPVDEHMKGRQGEFFLMFLASLLGMLLLTGTRDLLLLVVALELVCLPGVVILALRDDPSTRQNSFSFFVPNILGSLLALYGISFLWGLSGSTDFYALTTTETSPLFSFGCLLLVVGLAVKIGFVPFNSWVSDIVQPVQSVSLLNLSLAPKIAILTLLCRLVDSALYNVSMQVVWFPILLIICVLTMLTGALTAVSQNDGKRLVSWGALCHIGLLGLTIVIGGRDGKVAFIFYAFSLVVGHVHVSAMIALESRQGGTELSKFRGAFRRSPGIATAMLIGLVSLSGLPILVGFWGQFFVLRAHGLRAILAWWDSLDRERLGTLRISEAGTSHV